MSVQPNTPFVLEPGTYVAVGFVARRNDLVCWEVRSSSALAAYLLDEENFRLFEAGADWVWSEGHGNRVLHEKEFEIPRGGDWILLIHNRGNQIAGVTFDLWKET